MPNNYLLTYSMVQSPSRKTNWFAASQEIPRISRNPKVHYRTHKRTPPVSILGQPHPVQMPTSHLLEIHTNIIHPSTRRSPQWSISLRFPHQDPIHPPLLTHTRHMPSKLADSTHLNSHDFLSNKQTALGVAAGLTAEPSGYVGNLVTSAETISLLKKHSCSVTSLETATRSVLILCSKNHHQ